MTWERVRMGYKTHCSTCRGGIKRGGRAYVVGVRLLCLDCFAKTPEGGRVARAEAGRRRPMSKAEGLYLSHRGRGR